ncbi:hypothetical protein [Rickettsia endosymbiont of Halotydeus destructor]|uniref:hypothetical protein n=1 Tax=Rickettsia endosymbiont of Halotydeus destructor TaxID=2996754 RepID=UPI003BB0E29F
MLDYDLELVGPKIAEIKPQMESELENFSNDKKKIEYVKTKLFECISSDDIITALAIINCAIGVTGISAREFDLHCIEKKAYADFHGDFALSFIGCCEALHYFDE